jgi:glucans biosynthesis protein
MDRFVRPRTLGLFFAGWLGLAAVTTLATEPPVRHSAEDLFSLAAARAERLAGAPFKPSPKLPEAFAKLSYDDYRLIAFEPRRAVWENTDAPFRLEFFHRGFVHTDQVTIHLENDGRFEPFPFDAKLFQYRGRLASLTVPDDLGFAGFRVLGKFASSANFTEVAPFVGASYFRAIGEGQSYGTSARGLAVDIGMPKPEEFPAFREYWIARPPHDARSFTFAALLDSPSLTGAYLFILRPGRNTTIDVRAKLFFRREPEKLGLAPLSSMWMWGDGRPGPAGDPRPEVHDADGLLVHTIDDEWIWRPLTQLKDPSVCRFEFAGVRGFGLLQRDRTPEHYRDGEAKYDLRPSVWIEPKEPWRDGAVELLEFPSDEEGTDNIAAWWTPKTTPSPTEPLEYFYTVSFLADEPEESGLARAVALQTRRLDNDVTRIDVAFDRNVGQAADSAEQVIPEVSALRGTVVATRCVTSADRHLVTIDLRPDGREPVEVQAVLRQDGRPISETWRYLCRK